MKLEILCLFLLLFSSCASRKTSDKSLTCSDSLRQATRLTIRQITAPESCAGLQIPAAGLRSLPPAAVYTAKSGQATATVRFLRDTLFVTATCDSLQQLVIDYEQQIEQLNKCTETDLKKTRKNGFIWEISIVILVIATIVIFYSGDDIRSRSARLHS